MFIRNTEHSVGNRLFAVFVCNFCHRRHRRRCYCLFRHRDMRYHHGTSALCTRSQRATSTKYGVAHGGPKAQQIKTSPCTKQSAPKNEREKNSYKA